MPLFFSCYHNPYLGENVVLGVSTESAHYYLTAPHELYAKYFNRIREKAYLSKIVVQSLYDAQENQDQLDYEDLLGVIEKADVPEELVLNNECLVNNAGFVYNAVTNYERAGDDDEEKFMEDMPCMKHLLSLTNADQAKGKRMVKIRSKGAPKTKMPMSKATTTLLIRELFEEVFDEQMDDDTTKNKPKAPRRKKCGACDNCLAQDCGSCTHCKDMIKFGGSGKSKQSCIKRNCLNMVESINTPSDDEDAEVDDLSKDLKKAKKANKTLVEVSDDEDESSKENEPLNPKGQRSIKDCFIPMTRLNLSVESASKKPSRNVKETATWSSDPLGSYHGKVIHASAIINGVNFHAGDYVIGQGKAICQIIYFYEKQDKKRAHLKVFKRASETILDETADKHEIVDVNECSNVKISSIEV